VLGASVRWLLIYLGAAAVGIIVPLGCSAESLAWIAALGPIAWSVAGLVLPGRGGVWGRRLGARRPTGEEAAALGDAIELLRSVDSSLLGPAGWLVLDDPLPAAAARGRTVVVSRGLFEHDGLAPVLAHELGHANRLDGRLTEALNRLALWEDPLGPARSERGERIGSSSRITVRAASSGAVPAGRCASPAAALPSGFSPPSGPLTGAPASTRPTPTPPRSARPRTWLATSPTTSCPSMHRSVACSSMPPSIRRSPCGSSG
jgi:hypothetical protein